MPRLQAVPALAVAALLAGGPAAAADGRFAATPPPLGPTSYRAPAVQYHVDLAFRSYRSGATDLAGPRLSVLRRQALSDRFAFTLGGSAGYLSGSDSIIGADDDLRLWRTMFYVTGELQHHFTPTWNAILFAGPQFGVGGYEVEQQEPPGENRDAETELSGYLLGVQSTVQAGRFRVTPFVAYEENDARHEVDSSESGSSTTDYRYQVVQYGVRASLAGSGLTLGATVQKRSVGSRQTSFTIYNLGYRF